MTSFDGKNILVVASAFTGEVLRDLVDLLLKLQVRSLDFLGEGMSSNNSAMDLRRSCFVGLPSSLAEWFWLEPLPLRVSKK